DSDVTVPVTLVKQPEPEQPVQYRLTVRADPPDARVRLRGTRTVYRPGVSLPQGSYTVEVSRSGYETQQLTVRIADSDVTVPVALVKQPELAQPTRYRLTIRPNPANAWVRLVNSSYIYRPRILLPSGNYTVEVGGRGYESKRVTVQIADGDVTVPVELERIASVAPPSPPASAARPGEWRIGRVTVDSSLIGVDRSEVSRVLGGYAGRTVTRDTLLDAAMQVYRSTGITLSFVVRSSSSGEAELRARVARQTRRTYESTISVISRSQLERLGFGVSVE
ncbi:MAG: PEGA domain-containing protein, partial [Candidatus Competibacter sp.]|nr:PEGA domain-containing protein [Candidatus Competibacter sp.]